MVMSLQCEIDIQLVYQRCKLLPYFLYILILQRMIGFGLKRFVILQYNPFSTIFPCFFDIFSDPLLVFLSDRYFIGIVFGFLVVIRIQCYKVDAIIIEGVV